MDELALKTNIASVVISLFAVVTAILLSIIPGMISRFKEKRLSRNKIRNIFKIINNFFDEYRFYNTTTIIINHSRYLQYESDKINYRIDILSLLNSITDNIVLARYKDTEKLQNIYYLCYELFSGLPKPLLTWYLLEAKIVEYFDFDKSNKKYWLHEQGNNKDGKILVNHCSSCDKNYDPNDFLGYAEMDEERKYISRILNLDFCKRDKDPMHLMYV